MPEKGEVRMVVAFARKESKVERVDVVNRLKSE